MIISVSPARPRPVPPPLTDTPSIPDVPGRYDDLWTAPETPDFNTKEKKLINMKPLAPQEVDDFLQPGSDKKITINVEVDPKDGEGFTDVEQQKIWAKAYKLHEDLRLDHKERISGQVVSHMQNADASRDVNDFYKYVAIMRSEAYIQQIYKAFINTMPKDKRHNAKFIQKKWESEIQPRIVIGKIGYDGMETPTKDENQDQ